MQSEIPKQDLESFVKRWDEFYKKKGAEFSTPELIPRTEEEYRRYLSSTKVQKEGHSIIQREAKYLLGEYFRGRYIGYGYFWSKRQKGIVIYYHQKPASKNPVRALKINFNPFKHITAEKLFNKIWNTLAVNLEKE